MLSSIKSTSPSFCAAFSYRGLRDNLDLKLSSGQENSAMKSDMEQVHDIAHFLTWIRTEEAKQILDKLPDEDKVVCTAIYDDKIIPVIQINHNGVSYTSELRDSNKKLKDMFIQWVNNTSKAFAEALEKDAIKKTLLTPFTINDYNPALQPSDTSKLDKNA